ncbi:MAG: SAF domain-containing protein [Nocardioides sp.]
MADLPSLTRRVRRFTLRHRRGLAAVCAATAVLFGLESLQPVDSDRVEVVVAARDLDAGGSLTPDDLTTARWPAELVPDGVIDPTGMRLTGGVRAGEPIVDRRVLDTGMADDLRDRGLQAMPVRIPDATAVSLLRPGSLVDLWATDPATGEVALVADAALVLSVPTAPTDSTGPTGLPGGLVVLGVPSADVGKVAAAAARLYVTFTFAG